MENKHLFTVTITWKQDYYPQNFIDNQIENLLKTSDFNEANQVIDLIKNKIKKIL